MSTEWVASTMETDRVARPGGWWLDCFVDLGRFGTRVSLVAGPRGISNVVDFYDSIWGMTTPPQSFIGSPRWGDEGA